MSNPSSANAQLASPISIEDLVPVVYAELRAMAHRQLGGSGRGGTMTTTALVHEAYLKLADGANGAWNDRVHFLAVASMAMRQVLVDRAKALATLKRGGDRMRVTLDEEALSADVQPEALLQLEEAMTYLGTLSPRLVRVVECRFFGGLTEEEIASALGVTVRTVQRDWVKARMLLRRALEGGARAASRPAWGDGQSSERESASFAAATPIACPASTSNR